ncbi:MAG: hypothetical protein EBS38_07260 [Actinobacteria bacterium]|nr:hypothetical protein [Actinomycetota bacterium]
MSHSSEDPGHGNSVAAWTSVTIILVAFSVGTFFFFLENVTMVWISVAFVMLGIFAGPVLKKLGYGVGGKHSKSH